MFLITNVLFVGPMTGAANMLSIISTIIKMPSVMGILGHLYRSAKVATLRPISTDIIGSIY
ncbi:hypothetical protein M0R72_21850 [Candidatus Pacearchaeota archaeon]|nr:hypothetical protein [Candidatus Pacearchaeota archaeon]